jgi:hypothetical protein
MEKLGYSSDKVHVEISVFLLWNVFDNRRLWYNDGAILVLGYLAYVILAGVFEPSWVFPSLLAINTLSRLQS